jgi:hypothetical protein
MAERKLSEADRVALENLQLRAENLQLTEQGLMQQLSALQPQKQAEQQRRAAFQQYLVATYALDLAAESVRMTDGVIVAADGQPAAPEKPAIALVTGGKPKRAKR